MAKTRTTVDDKLMKEVLLSVLKWILLLVAAVTVRRACESGCDIIGAVEGPPWEVRKSDAFWLFWPGLIAFGLLGFRYFVSSVWFLYHSAYEFNRDEPVIPEINWLAKEPAKLSSIRVGEALVFVSFLGPQLLATYFIAFRVGSSVDLWFWIAVLPVIDLAAYLLWLLIWQGRALFVWLAVELVKRSGFAVTQVGSYAKPFVHGPAFLIWDGLDLLAATAFFVLWGLDLTTELWANVVAFVAVGAVSAANLSANWKYYRVYILFLTRARRACIDMLQAHMPVVPPVGSGS